MRSLLLAKLVMRCAGVTSGGNSAVDSGDGGYGIVVVVVGEEKKKSKGDDANEGDGKEKKLWKIEDGDIIGAAEARKSTTYLESLGYSLKKLVWS